MIIGNQVYDLKLIRMVVISHPKPRKLMVVEHLKIPAKKKWDDWAEHKVIIRVGRNRNYKGQSFLDFKLLGLVFFGLFLWGDHRPVQQN